MAKNKRVVLGVTGSIAAYKACDIVRRLMEQGCDVNVVMTTEATRLISPTTFAALSNRPVFSDLWDTHAWQMAHIEFAKADCLLIAPATANTIAKLAVGIADDCVTTTALASTAQLIIAPAMNDQMYQHPAVIENCATLKKRGAIFVNPIKGKLACGVVGVGHLADVEDIIKAVLK